MTQPALRPPLEIIRELVGPGRTDPYPTTGNRGPTAPWSACGPAWSWTSLAGAAEEPA
ncbi:MAG TPA: hypothetical protein VF612_12580 [Jatrophihabitans sp.]|uniref:hypothetical protein n=1 Tax=Jatrophihabitans sp. TaxID=1932789 RepID=UPI002F1B8C5B